MQPPECRIRSQSAIRRSSWCWCVWSCLCFAVSAPGWLNHGALCRYCTSWRWETAPRSLYQFLRKRESSSTPIFKTWHCNFNIKTLPNVHSHAHLTIALRNSWLAKRGILLDIKAAEVSSPGKRVTDHSAEECNYPITCSMHNNC